MNNLDLVKHCQMALRNKWGYVYGTFGTILNESTLQQKKKQYPGNVNQYETFIRQNWMGKHVVDCVGLIKSYLWWDVDKVKYNPSQDISANMMYSRAKEKGDISTIPEIPGILVWRNNHIGVYIGNGLVIESKGTKYGVIESKVSNVNSNGWKGWCKCLYIDYASSPVIEPPVASNIPDIEKLSNYAKEAHQFVISNSISDGNRPGAVATREEVWTMIFNYDKLKK